MMVGRHHYFMSVDIFDFIEISPLESNIILIGFFPLVYDIQLTKDHLELVYFYQ